MSLPAGESSAIASRFTDLAQHIDCLENNPAILSTGATLEKPFAANFEAGRMPHGGFKANQCYPDMSCHRASRHAI